MRALDGIDAVDLHEAEPPDQAEQARPGQLGIRRRAQPLQMQKQAAGLFVGNHEGHGMLYQGLPIMPHLTGPQPDACFRGPASLY